MQKLDKWTLATTMALLLGALMACKKEAPPPATSAPPPPPPPTASAAPADAAATTSDVTRYGDKEKEESGTVRVIYPNAKVYKEADENTNHISTLSLGTMVNRKARYGNWMLVDWPSGVGQLSPGWILSKHLDDRVLTVDLEALKHQDAGAVTVADAGPTVAVPDAAAPTTTPTPDAAAPTGHKLKIDPKMFKK